MSLLESVSYLRAVVSDTFDGLGATVDPVDVFRDWVIAKSLDIPQALDWKHHVRRVRVIHQDTTDGILLAEQHKLIRR